MGSEADKLEELGQPAGFTRWIRNRLVFIFGLLLVGAMAVASSLLLYMRVKDLKERLIDETIVTAQTVATQIAPSLEFDEPSQAEEILTHFKSDPGIRALSIRGIDGVEFASYGDMQQPVEFVANSLQYLNSDGLSAADVRSLVREQRGDQAARDFLIGRACHEGSEIAAAAREVETDYVTLSPLHATGGKAALGLERFEAELVRARGQARGSALPTWFALGGAGREDLGDLARLAGEGETWGLAGVRLFQEPESDVAAARLARSLLAALSSQS